MKATFLHELGSAFTGLTAYLFSAFLLLFGGMELLSRGNDPAGEVTAAMFFGWLGLLGALGAVAALVSRAIKLRWLKKQEQEEKIQL